MLCVGFLSAESGGCSVVEVLSLLRAEHGL